MAFEIHKIIVVFEDPNRPGTYYDADPFTVTASFKYQENKVRATIRKREDKWQVIVKVNKSRFTKRISTSKLLYCVGTDNYIIEDDKVYILISTLQVFIDEYAKIFVSRKYNLPYQLTLPMYGEPTADSADLSHLGIQLI